MDSQLDLPLVMKHTVHEKCANGQDFQCMHDKLNRVLRYRAAVGNPIYSAASLLTDGIFTSRKIGGNRLL
jgi:hypothetical protein